MYIEFSDAEVEHTQEYWFWKRLNHTLIFESNRGLVSASRQYIYDKYQTIFTDIPGPGPTKLRAVECPDKMETFFKLKYKEFL